MRPKKLRIVGVNTKNKTVAPLEQLQQPNIVCCNANLSKSIKAYRPKTSLNMIGPKYNYTLAQLAVRQETSLSRRSAGFESPHRQTLKVVDRGSIASFDRFLLFFLVLIGFSFDSG